MTTTATGGAGPRAPFGRRLAHAMETAGPLCLGVDPHPALLRQWGLSDTPAGLEAFSLTALEAAVGPEGPRVAAIKPQVALYERHGSAGLAALERLLAAARDAGVLTIADAKRGDIGSTMDGYAAAWTSDASPLAADAVTLSPYLGFGTLVPTIRAAHEAGRGVFVLALTSNPEGREVQHVGEGSAEGSVAGASPRPRPPRTRPCAATTRGGRWDSSWVPRWPPRRTASAWTCRPSAGPCWPPGSVPRAPRPRACGPASARPGRRSWRPRPAAS